MLLNVPPVTMPPRKESVPVASCASPPRLSVPPVVITGAFAGNTSTLPSSSWPPATVVAPE